MGMAVRAAQTYHGASTGWLIHGSSELWPFQGHLQLADIKTCARTGQLARVIQAVFCDCKDGATMNAPQCESLTYHLWLVV